jgi:hypothetical protein
VQIQLYLVATSTTGAVSTNLTQASWRKIQQVDLVPLCKKDDDFRLFCGMMDGLAFLPVPDLTNGIHLLRTLP